MGVELPPLLWTDRVAMDYLYSAQETTGIKALFQVVPSIQPARFVRKAFDTDCNTCGELVGNPWNHRLDGRCVYGHGYLSSSPIDALARIYRQKILPHHVIYWLHGNTHTDLFGAHTRLPPPLVEHKAEFGVNCSDAVAAFMRKHRQRTRRFRRRIVHNYPPEICSVTVYALAWATFDDVLRRWLKEDGIWA